MSDNGAFVAVNGLNKFYEAGSGRLHVLRDVDLEVRRGEMVAIVGASGVGKSTLLHLLGGLDRADSGSIRVAGTELLSLSDLSLVEFRNRNVGFVFQFHHLLPEFDARENVEMPMRIARMPLDEARRRASELLTRVGLAERLTHRPKELSGGQQQRVAIARALITQPALLLADEPTGNLDSKSSVEILALFEQLNQQGITVVLVTHEPDVAAHAGRVLTVRDGAIDSDAVSQRRISSGDRGLHHDQPQRRISVTRRPALLSRRRTI